MDMTESIAPKSDQLNAEDLLSGPRTFTIAEVKRGSAEQPVDVHLVEFPGRPFKPSKTVRRIMVGAWGPDASAYVGKRMTLYRDPAVKFGGMDVGGIRVSHMSGLTKPLTLALTVTRGKRAPYVVKPLADDKGATILPVNPPATGVTKEQLTAVNDGLTGLGISDRDVKLATVCQVIDREVGSANDLTRAEADTVLSWIEAEVADAAAAAPTLPEGAGPVATWGAEQ